MERLCFHSVRICSNSLNNLKYIDPFFRCCTWRENAAEIQVGVKMGCSHTELTRGTLLELISLYPVCREALCLSATYLLIFSAI